MILGFLPLGHRWVLLILPFGSGPAQEEDPDSESIAIADDAMEASLAMGQVGRLYPDKDAPACPKFAGKFQAFHVENTPCFDLFWQFMG